MDEIIKEFIDRNNENAAFLNYVGNLYQIPQLIASTKEYISNNHSALLIQILSKHQNDENFETKEYEEIISSNFHLYIKDSHLFDLSFPILYRIYEGAGANVKKISSDDIFDFLFKCLDKYGPIASVLFSGIDFDNISIKYLNLLVTKYSDRFDSHYINSNLLKTLLDQINENLKTKIENQRQHEILTQMKDNYEKQMAEMKDNYEKKISEITKEIVQLKESNKKLEDLLFKRIEKIEQNQKQFKIKEESIENNIEELKQKENENTLLINEITHHKVIKINHNEGEEFKGINNFLVEKCDGNINDIINITSNSIHGSFSPSNLIDYQIYSYYHSNNLKDATVCFDFKDNKVLINSYSIKSAGSGQNGFNLKNWIIEGSNDGINWVKIDESTNDASLNSAFAVSTFNINGISNFYKFIQLHQIGQNWSNSYWVVLHSLEFYGLLLTST